MTIRIVVASTMRNPKFGLLLLAMLAMINGALSLNSGPTQGMKQKQSRSQYCTSQSHPAVEFLFDSLNLLLFCIAINTPLLNSSKLTPFPEQPAFI